MTTTTTPHQQAGADYAERVRLNVNEALTLHRIETSEIAEALEVSIESVRRRRRGNFVWQTAELGVLASLIRAQPGREDFDAAEFSRDRA